MKRTALGLAMAALVAGCASTEQGSSSVSLGTGSPEVTLYCQDGGLADCHNQARRYCGEAGYREVRQLGTSGYTTAGRGGDSRTEELLGRADRRGTSQTSMTITCREPRPGSE
jgi:hypothetical protein